jgi:peptide/nickel transport system substrate-binding protein
MGRKSVGETPRVSRRRSLALLASATGAAWARTASAQAPQAARTLRIGITVAPSSLDPHFQNASQNNSALRHIYDTLVTELGQAELQPCLAESWRQLDPLTWEFVLRRGVTFSDGTPFTADDVLFSFARVPTIPNSPALYTPYVKVITGSEAVDDHTLRFKTASPYPFLPRDLAWVQILSRRLHGQATTADFNAMHAAIGTGPYTVTGYQAGDALQLARNRRYWGNAPAWDAVTLKAMPVDATRLIALIAGDVDLIARIGTADLARAQADQRLDISLAPSDEVVFLFPDATRDHPPGMSDKQGKPLTANPLRDVRVRRALSMAIDRAAIVSRVMAGAGAPAAEMAVPSEEGYDPAIPPIPYDPAAARHLLADAGWPDGWAMTITGPEGFIANDTEILQAVAQYFTRVGVETKVETVPPAVFFGRATARDYVVFMTSFVVPVAFTMFKGLLVTKNADTGDGAFNRHLYSNPRVDALVAQASSTVDAVARDRLMAQAMEAAMDDLAVIPLVTTMSSWATRKGSVTYHPVPIGWAWAMLAEPG